MVLALSRNRRHFHVDSTSSTHQAVSAFGGSSDLPSLRTFLP
jgi:hypothetical protein